MNVSGFPLSLNLPDLWQQEAVRHLRDGRDAIVDAPTGAGKTRVFEWLIEGGGLRGQAVYTVPTRALANDKRLEWKRRGWKTGIVTGEIAEDADAPVVVATLEAWRERLFRGQGPALMVVDEYQMLADPHRGTAYETAIALTPPESRLLLLSGSVDNPGEVADWLRRLGRRVEVVTVRERPVPLEEVPVEQLPRQAPARIAGFWPRLAAGVLLSGFGPLLIFAPHRRDAERIARRIATALPPAGPLNLTAEQERVLGRHLAPLLRERVAVHHSGLTWQQRAGVIEPLAKAGQLRVVVATMGLAAGINFSMRSAMVSDTRYFDGRTEREIEPDELLQMFGRAGRRGLDDAGYVIVTGRGPHLADAARRRLRRVNQVDWPVLLRVMARAAAAGESPPDAAARFCESMFGRQRIALGFDRTPVAADGAASGVTADGAMFGVTPSRTDIRNSRGGWEEKRRDRIGRAPLREALVASGGRLLPATAVREVVARAVPGGRIRRLDGTDSPRFGCVVTVATAAGADRFLLTRNVRALLSLRRGAEFACDAIGRDIVPQLGPLMPEGGSPAGLVQRGAELVLQVDVGAVPVDVYRDSAGAALVDPAERTVDLDVSPNLRREPDGPEFLAAPNTAARAWRKLGLIDADGTPTRRGVVFSWFHGGEGLAIAAALEDPTFPPDDLARQLASLRGGYRFRAAAANSRGGERIAAACLHAYGAANYEGYLEAGLPPEYGEGTATWLSAKPGSLPEEIGPGDIERAFAEWISLLRNVVNAPGVDWERWRDFRNACAAELAVRLPDLPSRELPAVPASQLVRAPDSRPA